MVSDGGPRPDQYDLLTAFLDELFQRPRDKVANMLEDVRRILLPTFTTETMQGFAFQRPHGYAGDFEMIDRIYKSWSSPNPRLKRWDEYFHQHHAPRAVRNRKQYFINCLRSLPHEPSRVLNVASGPARDLYEYLSDSDCQHTFIRIDLDPEAIDYGQGLCSQFLDRVNFIHANALRFTTAERFDLIWSGGLFDYLEDRLFVLMLKRLLRFLSPNGEWIIGNFNTVNPSRSYMELGHWSRSTSVPIDCQNQQQTLPIH